MKDQLMIFDTTLRDGEQSPGASMTRDEKVRIAKVLERMRVDVIEAGFPAASNGDFESVQAVDPGIWEVMMHGRGPTGRDVKLSCEYNVRLRRASVGPVD